MPNIYGRPSVQELMAAGYSRAHAEQFAALGYIPRDKRKLPRATRTTKSARKGNSK